MERDVMGFWDTVRSFLGMENRDQLRWLLAQADNWRVGGADAYKTEVARRRAYSDGDMKADALTLLKQEFPKLWRDLADQRLEYPIAQFITDKRAQVFRGKGARFYLQDRDSGEEVDASSREARTFAHLVDHAGLDSALVDMNRCVENVPEGAARVWWDRDHCEVSVWWPDEVHVAVNPDRPWDPHSAMAVLFEMSGVGGVSDASRYEVWGTRDPSVSDETDEAGRRIFLPSMHYIATANEQIPVNESDSNPFKDRLTGLPVYPFAWFKTYRGDAYAKIGGDDLVGITRVVNLGLTWLNWNLHWGMTPIPVFDLPAGQTNEAMVAKLKGTYLHSPKHAMALPPGVKLSFVSPNTDPAPFTNTFEMMIQMLALMKHLSPKHLDIRGGLPASGIALRIELDGLVRHNAEMTKLLRPAVDDTLEKLIVVGNEYMPHAHKWATRIGPKLVGAWDHGQYDAGPTDYVELGNRYSAECGRGVSSYADWAMAVHGIKTKEEAEDRIRLNLKFNAEVDRLGTRYPGEPDAAERAAEDLPTDEPEAKPAETSAAGEGVEGAEADKIVANVYQIVKAIDVGAATAVDLRQALYPAETRDQAEAIVRSNLEFNLEVAEQISKVREAEAGGPPAVGALKGVTAKDKKADDELQEFVKE